jgi:hypothetical protein
MNKNNKLSGQPVICQLFSFIPGWIIEQAVENYGSDRYYKTLTTQKQLIFLLYGVITRSKSLRSLCKSLLFLEKKLLYIGVDKLPAVSTLSDANINRSSEVFGQIYFSLYNHYRNFLSDSYISPFLNGEVNSSDVERFDATTITLFSEVFRGTGRFPLSGKRKGGLKVQAKLPMTSAVPDFITFQEGRSNDKNFLGQLEVVAGKIYVFDKGYENYDVFKLWSLKGVEFVTRLRENATYRVIQRVRYDITEYNTGGVVKDELVEMGNGFIGRVVTYLSPSSGEILQFLTNGFYYQPLTIALLFKQRWSIEVLFKQVKQNFELYCFYSDNKEGIKSQVWAALIANLLFTVIHKQVKECEQFTTIVAISSNNLGSYVCLVSILKEKKLDKEERDIGDIQFSIFNTS